MAWVRSMIEEEIPIRSKGIFDEESLSDDELMTLSIQFKLVKKGREIKRQMNIASLLAILVQTVFLFLTLGMPPYNPVLPSSLSALD
jgi:hypothetical protein